MNVYVYPSDTEACGHYRLYWAAIALKKAGHNVKILHPNHPNRVFGSVAEDSKTLTGVGAPKDADVMVFQRVTSAFMLQAIPLWQRHGIAVVIDMDDDLSMVHPSNPAWAAIQPRSTERMAEYNWQNAQKICDIASWVTVSSDALLRRYAPHGRGSVIKNFVPEEVLKIPHVETPKLVGWGGTVRTHPNDPPVVGGAIARLQRDGYTFGVVGPSIGVQKAFSCSREPTITGGVNLSRWHHELAKFAVGIAPLADTKFNHAKSWLKLIEYAAVGVPYVASPTSEYRAFHQRVGHGFLAASPRDWYRHVSRLLKDDALRADYSRALREIAREFTIEGNAWRWLEAWQSAFQVERGSSSLPFRRPLSTTTGQTQRGPQTS